VDRGHDDAGGNPDDLCYGRPEPGIPQLFLRAGLCTGCRVTIDGTVKRACHVILEAGREYVVEPLKNYPVIRDLVVDFGLTRIDPESGREFQLREGVTL